MFRGQFGSIWAVGLRSRCRGILLDARNRGRYVGTRNRGNAARLHYLRIPPRDRLSNYVRPRRRLGRQKRVSYETFASRSGHLMQTMIRTSLQTRSGHLMQTITLWRRDQSKGNLPLTFQPVCNATPTGPQTKWKEGGRKRRAPGANRFFSSFVKWRSTGIRRSSSKAIG